ncbi:hypothetical protein PLICBS_000875 [Purpureocillium lilacinum]|uniref:uncharacterized protein n=1 Tax=Purpureocillium lilacinum TaxID=33203 RepID=UPI002085399D|nr:hypothetical protein PLICBS_000875 [Purpureocillium lilacinum]
MSWPPALDSEEQMLLNARQILGITTLEDLSDLVYVDQTTFEDTITSAPQRLSHASIASLSAVWLQLQVRAERTVPDEEVLKAWAYFLYECGCTERMAVMAWMNASLSASCRWTEVMSHERASNIRAEVAPLVPHVPEDGAESMHPLPSLRPVTAPFHIPQGQLHGSHGYGHSVSNVSPMVVTWVLTLTDEEPPEANQVKEEDDVTCARCLNTGHSTESCPYMPLSGTIHPANIGNVSLTQAGSTTDLTGVVNHPNPDPTTQTGAAIPDNQRRCDRQTTSSRVSDELEHKKRAQASEGGAATFGQGPEPAPKKQKNETHMPVFGEKLAESAQNKPKPSLEFGAFIAPQGAATAVEGGAPVASDRPYYSSIEELFRGRGNTPVNQVRRRTALEMWEEDNAERAAAAAAAAAAQEQARAAKEADAEAEEEGEAN